MSIQVERHASHNVWVGKDQTNKHMEAGCKERKGKAQKEMSKLLYLKMNL